MPGSLAGQPARSRRRGHTECAVWLETCSGPQTGCSAWLGSAVPISALSPVCPALPSTGAGGELGGRLKSCLSEGTPDIGVETSEGPGRMQSCVTCPWSHRKPVAETNQTLLAGYRARLDP